ncbi:MAG: response regulator transcription factor [Ardenticatenaceae bacterium]|nr:response regulator transcription factor [Ardenticatenaceae bacterium]
MKVFIVAEDQEERDMYKMTLQRTGLNAVPRVGLSDVLKDWMHDWADLLILAYDKTSTMQKDVARLRNVTRVPLFVISDPIPEHQQVAILQAGADLFWPRPVSPRLLAVYAKVLLRRIEAIPAFVLPSLKKEELIALDPETRTVTVMGREPQRLTRLEFYLLYVLMTNEGQVVPFDVIVERVWGYDEGGSRDLVRGLVSRLRRKLEPTADDPKFIHTIPDLGYRFAYEETAPLELV